MASTLVSQSHTRVLLLSDESPLSLGVEVLLRDRTVLEVICDLSEDKVLERIRAFQPHAVVVGTVPGKNEPAGKWLQVLSDVPGFRLITLSLQDNCVRIYDRGQMQTVPDAAGLLSVIESPPA